MPAATATQDRFPRRPQTPAEPPTSRGGSSAAAPTRRRVPTPCSSRRAQSTTSSQRVAEALPATARLANMVERGVTPHLSRSALRDLGLRAHRLPLAALYAAASGDRRPHRAPRQGATSGALDRMVTFDEFNALVDLDAATRTRRATPPERPRRPANRAGDRGIEPRARVLETHVLPLHQSPSGGDCTDAGGGTRTPKGVSPPAPKAGASTSSATPALRTRTASATAARGRRRLYVLPRDG